MRKTSFLIEFNVIEDWTKKDTKDLEWLIENVIYHRKFYFLQELNNASEEVKRLWRNGDFTVKKLEDQKGGKKC